MYIILYSGNMTTRNGVVDEKMNERMIEMVRKSDKVMLNDK